MVHQRHTFRSTSARESKGFRACLCASRALSSRLFISSISSYNTIFTIQLYRYRIIAYDTTYYRLPELQSCAYRTGSSRAAKIYIPLSYSPVWAVLVWSRPALALVSSPVSRLSSLDLHWRWRAHGSTVPQTTAHGSGSRLRLRLCRRAVRFACRVPGVPHVLTGIRLSAALQFAKVPSPQPLYSR